MTYPGQGTERTVDESVHYHPVIGGDHDGKKWQAAQTGTLPSARLKGKAGCVSLDAISTPLALAEEVVKTGDTIIFRVDEYRDNRMLEHDGQVIFIKDQGVEVVYMSGYKTRHDIIPWQDVIAKLDLSKPYIDLKKAPYKGHFDVFDKGQI